MMDRDEIKALIDEAYEARRRGDIEAILAVFHPDAKMVIAGAETLTKGVGTAQGHGELWPALAGLIAGFEFVARDLVSIVIENDRAAVHSRVKLRFIPKDRTVTTDVLDLWRIDNGKIVELVEFVDTALINDLMR